jgi:hypothetical protein
VSDRDVRPSLRLIDGLRGAKCAPRLAHFERPRFQVVPSSERSAFDHVDHHRSGMPFDDRARSTDRIPGGDAA